MLETEIRTLILFRGDIVNRVLQNFFSGRSYKCPAQYHHQEGAAAGESDGITGAPS